MQTVVNAKHISKAYSEGGAENHVLTDVSIQVNEDEFVAVMGPSGSGKSTLLYCVSGMDSVDEGDIELCQRALRALTEDELCALRRRDVGFVFQQPSLLKNLNILDNVMLTSLRENKKDAPAIRKRAQALLEKAGIAELAERDISKVSGGQLQRAGVCRALMSAPKILFCDEPTGALNSKSAQEIMALFSAVSDEGTAILLVTHDAGVAARSERVVFMQDGRIADELTLGQYAGDTLAERTALVTEKAQSLGI